MREYFECLYHIDNSIEYDSILVYVAIVMVEHSMIFSFMLRSQECKTHIIMETLLQILMLHNFL